MLKDRAPKMICVLHNRYSCSFVLCGFVELFSCSFAFTLLHATMLFKLSKEVDSLSDISQSRIRDDRTHAWSQNWSLLSTQVSVFSITVWQGGKCKHGKF